MTRFIFMRRDYTYIVTDKEGRFVSSHRRKDSAKRLIRTLNSDPSLDRNQPYKAEKVKTYR